MNLKGPMMVNNFGKHLNTYREPELQEEIRANVRSGGMKKGQLSIIQVVLLSCFSNSFYL